MNQYVDYEFKNFIDDWYKSHYPKVLENMEDNRAAIRRRYKSDAPVIDYNEEVIRLTDEFINRDIKRLCEVSENLSDGLSEDLYDDEYRERYKKWMLSLKDKELVLIKQSGYYCFFSPEIGMFFALSDGDYEYVSHWRTYSDSERLLLFRNKLKELMSEDDYKAFIAESFRIRVI